MFSTVQKITGQRRGTMIFALRETRVRLSNLRSTCTDCVPLPGSIARPARSQARKRTPDV
jgi:hypothetical protein